MTQDERERRMRQQREVINRSLSHRDSLATAWDRLDALVDGRTIDIHCVPYQTPPVGVYIRGDDRDRWKYCVASGYGNSLMEALCGAIACIEKREFRR